MPVRIAVQIRPEQADYADMARALDHVEDMGADIAYTWDHFFPLFGDRDGKHLECWTVLAAWAERSRNILIGPLVSATSYRNPQLLADMARTVDVISGGRLILGLGAGWFERDYTEYGFEFGTAGSRLRTLDRALPLIKARLAKLNPPPTGPMPIMIGGGGEKVTLRITAEHADIWHGFGSVDVLRHKMAVLDRWCEKVERDPADIERSAQAPLRARSGAAAVGDPLVEAGIRQITLAIDGPDFDTTGLDEWLAWRDAVNG